MAADPVGAREVLVLEDFWLAMLIAIPIAPLRRACLSVVATGWACAQPTTLSLPTAAWRSHADGRARPWRSSRGFLNRPIWGIPRFPLVLDQPRAKRYTTVG